MINKEPLVSANKYLEYKKANGHFGPFVPPKIVLVCYQQSTLKYLLEKHPEMQPSAAFSDLYLMGDSQIGVLGGWGVGAPGLSIKMEELIALGVKQFIAVGTAGTLMNTHKMGDFVIATKALAEDGVAHLYLSKGEGFSAVDEQMLAEWSEFTKERSLPYFHSTTAWSFSAVYRETAVDVSRVVKQGCGVVEMEAATLYAIAKEKGVQALSLFVISDSLTLDAWVLHFKEPAMRSNLHQLAEWALEFCNRQIPVCS